MPKSVKQHDGEQRSRRPIARNEDVQYSEELADAADREAQKRANAADQRQGIRP
ncbi:YfhD family protein [Brevibacillus marinus]|uniref:YfhD family protein n=1 Tax=Brevibacillus marinus TaxID=2496837 RepID=UPI000F84A15F|nr:YfhD family protein [Brevibacillus marinus]